MAARWASPYGPLGDGLPIFLWRVFLNSFFKGYFYRMSVHVKNYEAILAQTAQWNAQLVAVSKIKPLSDIQALYDLGQRDFGENYVQELVEKQAALPADIRWHFIGHLQSNKVKYLASFVYLIQGVDSEKLLLEIDKQAKKHGRIINCLLQVHIAQESTKFGFSRDELLGLVQALPDYQAAGKLQHVQLMGLMGMASFTEDAQQLIKEFDGLHQLHQELQSQLPGFNTLSMGMSSDYALAVEHGSNMIRVGSLLFGSRQ